MSEEEKSSPSKKKDDVDEPPIPEITKTEEDIQNEIFPEEIDERLSSNNSGMISPFKWEESPRQVDFETFRQTTPQELHSAINVFKSDLKPEFDESSP